MVAKLFAKATTKLGLATTIAALWLTAVSPVMAQKYSSGEVETSRHDSLLPPRVDRVDVRASLLYWGMPGADVEQIMGVSAELQTYDGPGGNVRILSYPTEPIATIVSIRNGQVSGVRLDLAGNDEPTLPAYSRPVWLGMDRTTVLRILGDPTYDQLHDSSDMKLEHMIFRAPRAARRQRVPYRGPRGGQEGRQRPSVGHSRFRVAVAAQSDERGDRCPKCPAQRETGTGWHEDKRNTGALRHT